MENSITWEVVETMEVLSVHDSLVRLEGVDQAGNEYEAEGDFSCGEIVEIRDITLTNKVA